MKIYDKIRILEQDENYLRFSENLGRTIGVTDGVTLNTVILRPQRALNEVDSPQEHELLQPAFSIICTPFPIAAWPNLIRACITVPPKPGALLRALKRLNRLGLYSRYFESSNGVDLDSHRIFARKSPGREDTAHKRRRTDGQRKANNDKQSSARSLIENLVIPTTIIFLEVPVGLPEAVKQNPNHKKLLKLAQAFARSRERNTNEVREELEYYLNGEGRYQGEVPTTDGISVDWISPMATLSRLAKPENFGNFPAERDASDNTPKVSDDADHIEELKWHSRRSAREKILVRKLKDDYALDIGVWSNLIWNRKDIIPDSATNEEKMMAIAIGHADSDEKVICWDIFRRDFIDRKEALKPSLSTGQQKSDFFIAAIEMLVPTGGFEHIWCEWIFQRLEEIGANCITATTWARLDGDWGSFEIVLAIPLKEDVDPVEEGTGGKAKGDIGRTIHCFKQLQGHEGGTKEFSDFCDHLKEESRKVKSVLEGYQGRGGDPHLPRTKSTLQIKGIWDPRHDTKRSYSDRFAPNPFKFTNPLDAAEYAELSSTNALLQCYLNPTESNQRHRLVKTVTDQLTDSASPPNISIVGAHRSGKTTILNLIDERLRQVSPSSGERIRAVPIRIHAGTTPPWGIFPMIAKEINETFEDKGKMKHFFPFLSPQALEKAKESLKEGLRELATRFEFSIGPSVKGLDIFNASLKRPKGAFVRKALIDLIRAKTDPLRQLEAITWYLEGMSEEQGAYFLRDSMETLKNVVGTLQQVDPNLANLRLIILMDEVGSFRDWGNETFLQAWRYALESKHFQDIRWVISASRPIAQTSILSPVSNVFQEYILGGLSPDESEQLLNQFMAVTEKNTYPSRRTQQQSADERREENSDNDRSEDDYNKLRPLLTFRARVFIGKWTSRLPYFLQVFLYHIYDQAVNRRLPLVNRKMCADVLIDFVLPEIGEFLQQQWNEIPKDIQKSIRSLLHCCPQDPRDFLRNMPEDGLSDKRLAPHQTKILLRAGLKGDDDLILSPVAILWLLTGGLDEDLTAEPDNDGGRSATST